MKLAILALAVVAVASAFPQPQKEGGAYTNEAIRQAQQTFLIPKDAQIQKVSINLVDGISKLDKYFFLVQTNFDKNKKYYPCSSDMSSLVKQIKNIY